MSQEHDELFAKYSIQLKMLSPGQVMACRDVLAELESAGIVKMLAVVAVDQGELKRADAAKLIDAINKKFPGKHPPLPAPLDETTIADEPAGEAAPPPPPPRKAAAAAKPAARPAAPPARRSAPRPAGPPPPAAKGPSKVVLIGGGAAAVVALAIIAVVVLGKESKPPAETAKTPAVDVKPAPPPPPPPKKEDPPAKGPEPKPEARPEPKLEPKSAPPPADQAKQAELKKEFDERMAERQKEARQRFDEVKKELDAERKEAEQQAEATRKRLAGKKISLALSSGESIKDAIIKSYTFHGAELEAAGKETRITWDTVVPASLGAVAEALFDPKIAQDQFDRGRFFVARRMWKEAQAAFGAAAKLGQGFESRVLEFSEVLDRLVSGQGGFRGSARRTGRDSVHLSWDWHEAKQLEDFTHGLVLANGAVTLEAQRKASVYFLGGTSSGSDDNPLGFVGNLTATMKLSCDGPVTFHLFAGVGGGYEIDLGPSGAALFKIDPKAPEKDRRKPVAKAEKAKLPAGKTCEVSLTVKYPRFTLTVDKAEALAVDDGPVSVTAEPPKGAFGFGIGGKGKLRLEAPLELDGRAEPGELDRRINDTEVMVRRALDPDLEQIERFRSRKKAMSLLGEERDVSLSADDQYFAFRIKKFEDITRYEALKKRVRFFDDKNTPEQWRKDVDGLIAAYPDVPSLYYLRAIFRHDHQDMIGGLADARKAVEIFPDFHEAHALQAEMLLEQQEPEKALEAVKRSLEARADYVEGYVLRARCVYATSQSMQAFMEDLDIARKLDPQDSGALTVQRMLKYQRLGPRELGCRFDYETPHYRVTTDISMEASKKYGDNLEAAYRHYSTSFKNAGMRSGKKPRVAIFNTAENYYTYFELLSEDRGENTLGVFWPSLNELVLFEKSSDLADTNHTLYHEAVHQFMTILTNRTPPFWYNEGIAEYMGSIKVQDGKVLEKGLVLKDRLPYAQLAIEVKADLAFDKIMNETPREFYSGQVGLKYAQAWSMIHFFYEYEKGKYKPLIEEYFELLRAGRTPRDCFDAVFKAKQETLEKEWREFTKGLK